ncbi:MAG: hypothetical protein WBR13_05180 [Allosphingosinicella sp.]
MRNPGRKAIYGILCILLTGAILWLLPPGFMDDPESIPTLATTMALFMLGVSGVYLLLSGSYRALRMKSLLAGEGVIARWQVPPDVWTRFRTIGLEDTGVRIPNLRGLDFIPRRTTPSAGVTIVAGDHGAIIDDCYYGFSRRGIDSLEHAGMTLTEPRCIALVIARIANETRINKWLLLLPVAPGAEDQARRAFLHYSGRVAERRDLRAIAAANPRTARRVLGVILGLSIACAAAGFYLRSIGDTGDVSAGLAIAGIMVGLATLFLGWLILPKAAR